MKRLALIAAVIAIATPAMAQNWTSYQSGSQTNHTGRDESGGTWTGRSYQSGSQINSEFYGPNGQSKTCRSYQSGSQINTECQ